MKVKFSDVVRRANTKEDRFNTDKEFYVGGEHMITGEYLITRRGTIAGSNIGPMFYFGFKKGQVLLASRSPDLKKAGMVTFDGICSEKTFVIETKDESVLLQDFLPAIVRSESFWKYANDNQSGSVNHFINWTTFANYEFDLPDIETQRKLSALLWTMERTKTAYKNLIAKTDELVKSQFVEMFGLPDSNGHAFEIARIGDVVCDVHYGTSRKALDDGEFTYLRMNNITYGGELDLTDTKRISVPDKELAGCIVKKGDVLFNRTNSRELVGKTCAFKLDEPMIIAGYIIRLRMNGRVLPEYLSAFLNLDSSKKLLFTMAKGAVGQANINAQEVQSIQIVVPPMEAQISFQRLVEQSDKSKFAAQQALADLTGAQKALMRQYLG